MNVVGRVIVGVAKFLYGYIVGDDLLLAVVMVLGLVATGSLVSRGIAAYWLIPLLAVVMTGVHLRLEPDRSGQVGK
jgi:uncharacterized membrane protein YccC